MSPRLREFWASSHASLGIFGQEVDGQQAPLFGTYIWDAIGQLVLRCFEVKHARYFWLMTARVGQE